MIRIDAEAYCQTCVDFKPIVTMFKYDDPEECAYDTIVSCKYKERCARVAAYEKLRSMNQEAKDQCQ